MIGDGRFEKGKFGFFETEEPFGSEPSKVFGGNSPLYLIFGFVNVQINQCWTSKALSSLLNSYPCMCCRRHRRRCVLLR